jgi:hypothetical protein
MKRQCKPFQLPGLVLAGVFAFFSVTHFGGCAKEYSFEGSDTEPGDTITVPPPPPAPVSGLPRCALCDTYPDPVNEKQWKLKADESVACGIIDTAIVTFDRSAFTFFGPSACSRDTGIVMTIYLETKKLDRDMSNVYISKVSFYYYDRVTPSYIFISSAAYPFSMVIEQYDHQTKMATGHFDGFARRTNGINAVISAGRFKVKLL